MSMPWRGAEPCSEAAEIRDFHGKTSMIPGTGRQTLPGDYCRVGRFFLDERKELPIREEAHAPETEWAARRPPTRHH
jgi:hypothetical protein